MPDIWHTYTTVLVIMELIFLAIGCYLTTKGELEYEGFFTILFMFLLQVPAYYLCFTK